MGRAAFGWAIRLGIRVRMQWIAEHWLGVASLALMGGGVWWMMPRRENLPAVVGLIAALAGAFLVASRIRAAQGPLDETILFSVFSLAAIACAILMVTNRNPVYAALWFAL